MFSLWTVLIVVLVVLIIYLLMIKPRNQAIHNWKPYQEQLYAHRGLYDPKKGIPENSRAAFKRAIEAGYGFELDVQLTRDQVPVVFHDFNLNRMCGVDKRVDQCTWDEIKDLPLDGTTETIPLFSEILEMNNGKVPFILEYKSENLDFSVCPIVNKMLVEYQGPYIIESFNPLILSWYRSNRNDVIRGQLSFHYRRDGYKKFYHFLLTNLLANWISRPDFIAYCHEDCNNFGFKMCTQFFKAKPVAWTIRSQQELDKAKEHFSIFIFEKFIPNNRSIVKVGDEKK